MVVPEAAKEQTSAAATRTARLIHGRLGMAAALVRLVSDQIVKMIVPPHSVRRAASIFISHGCAMTTARMTAVPM